MPKIKFANEIKNKKRMTHKLVKGNRYIVQIYNCITCVSLVEESETCYKVMHDTTGVSEWFLKGDWHSRYAIIEVIKQPESGNL